MYVAASALSEPKVMAAMEPRRQQVRMKKDTHVQSNTLFSPTQAQAQAQAQAHDGTRDGTHDGTGTRSALEEPDNHVHTYRFSSQSAQTALEALYDATNGDAWSTNTGWKGSTDLNTWFGVTATSSTVVTKVSLNTNSLAGVYGHMCMCVIGRFSCTLY
jgi:hypothetical protein